MKPCILPAVIGILSFFCLGEAAGQRFHFGFQAGLIGSRTRSLELASIPPLHMHPGLRPGDRVGVLMGSNLNLVAEYRITKRSSLVAEPGFLFQSYFRRVLDTGITTSRVVWLQLPVLYKQHLIGKMNAVIGVQPRVFLFSRRLDSPGNTDALPSPHLNFTIYGVVGLHAVINTRLEGGFRLARAVGPVVSVAPVRIDEDGQVTDTRAELTNAYQIYLQYIL